MNSVTKTIHCYLKVRGLYKGLSANIVRLCPAVAMQMPVMEQARRFAGLEYVVWTPLTLPLSDSLTLPPLPHSPPPARWQDCAHRGLCHSPTQVLWGEKF
jgi:hypothetical protein